MYILIGFGIIVFLINAMISSSSILSYRSKRKLYAYIVSLLFITLYMLNDTATFPDLPIYKDVFENIIVGNEINFSADSLNFEKGYLWLNIVIRYIWNNFNILRLCFIVFAIYVLSTSTYKHSSIPWMTYILFICVTFYSTIYIFRQSFALFIILYGYKYVVDRNLKKYIICILIAFLFHKTALICIFVYFLYPIKINWKTLLLIFIISMGVTKSLTLIMNAIGMYIHDINDYIIEEAENISIISLMIPFSTLAFALFCLGFKELNEYNKLFVILGIIECILVSMSFIVSDFQQFYRLQLYFSIGKIFLLPNAISVIESKYLRFSYCSIWLIFWYIYLYVNVNALYGFRL